MSFINGLSGIDGLRSLPNFYEKMIQRNRGSISKVLNRANNLNGLGKADVPAKRKNLLTFNEMIKRYNAGITEEEIKAWVWYRRSIGIPMFGWEKYFIDSSTGDEANILITTQETIIRDNHFRELKVVPKGTVLGKSLEKSHKYDKTTFIFYRDNEGIKMADKKHVTDGKNKIKTDPSKLDQLVKSGALFYMGGELLPYPVYAYGNMYDRDIALKNDKNHILSKYGKDIYEKHVEVIKKSKPEFLSLTNPDGKQRPKILAISKFAVNQEEGISIKVTQLKEESNVVLEKESNLQQAYKEWLETLDRSEFDESSSFNIRYYYLEGHNLPRNLEKEQKGELRRTTRNEGERLFDRFLHEALTFEDQQKIDFAWNRMYNGQSNLAHHKIPIGFECSSRFQNFNFELRPPQREGIAFMDMVGSGIIAYDVGVGKTITAIAEIANSIKQGKCKRPLVVVPNPTYNKWIKEMVGIQEGKDFIEGILSHTGVKLNDWYNLGTKYQSKINLEKAVPEGTITLVTYEGFKRIGFGDSVAGDLFTELVNILQQSDVEKSVRDKEIEYQKYRESIGVGLKNTIADIDILGFDYIVVDEGHNCKNVFAGVKKNNQGHKRFGMTGATSETGIKAFFICNYIQRKYGRNVMLLTATPFTNSPLEIYSMLSLVAYEGLHDQRIYNINDFFERFVLETTEDVVNYKDEIVQKDIVKSFNNRLLLQKLIYNHINYKTGDEAGVRRPCKINLPKVNELKNGMVKKLPPSKQTLTYLKMTQRQKNNQAQIIAYAKKASAKGGEILKAMNFSLNNAIHPAFFDHIPSESYKDFIEESPKLLYTVECIRTVKKYHETRNEHVSGQVIYMNRGKDYFHYLKEFLEKEVGYKKDVKWGKYKVDEVEIIDSSIPQNKKEKIKDAFLGGACKIIIGTASIREGIDLQKKGTVIYDLLPDWNPTDIRQLEGRIWRQKNEYGYVRIVMPLVQDSMDIFIFQKLEEKTSRINDIWYRGDRGNVLDLESLDPEEVKFALLTDITAIADSILKKEVKLQERKIAGIEDSIKTLREINRHKSYYETYKERLYKAVQRKKSDMEGFSYIRQRLSENDIKKLLKSQLDNATSADIKTSLKKHANEAIKDLSLYDDLIKLLEKTPYDDKELLAIARKLDRRFQYFDSYTIGQFKESFSTLKKAERTILASKGYTLDDDIEKVLKEYKTDFEKAVQELSEIKSDQYRKIIENDVKARKAELNIAGKSIMERVQEFAALNHVLSYKFSDIDPLVCIIPDKDNPVKVMQPHEVIKEVQEMINPDKEKRLRIAKVKAKAKLKILQLTKI